MPRQMLPFASRLTLVTWALRRCSGSAPGCPAAAVAGGQPELGPALPEPVRRPRRRQVAQRPPGQRGGRDTGREERPADLVGAGHDRLAQEVGAQLVQLADGLAVEGPGEARVSSDA